MTHSKKIKQLEELINTLGEDFVIIKYNDFWASEYSRIFEGCRQEFIRVKVTLKHVLLQLNSKEGVLYKRTLSTAEFRNFVKTVTDHYFKPRIYNQDFQDSYEKFDAKWKEVYPDKTYKFYIKEEEERERRRASRSLENFTSLYNPYTFPLRRHM